MSIFNHKKQSGCREEDRTGSANKRPFERIFENVFSTGSKQQEED